MSVKVNRKQHGFTLIELLIAVTIIGILTTLAFANYSEQARRAARSEAKSALLAIAAAQEKEYLKSNAYSDDLTALGFVNSDNANATESGRYNLSVELSEEGGFLADAVLALGVDSDCTKLSVDQIGRRTSEGSETASVCWK